MCALGALALPTGAQPRAGLRTVASGRADHRHGNRVRRRPAAGDSHRKSTPDESVAAATTTSTTTSTTTTTTTTTTSTTLPPQSFVQPTAAEELPPAGEATAFGCAAAAQYIAAYAAPGFSLACPAYSEGHQATTICVTTTSPCNLERVITIADPCAAAYMNEASNSWVLLDQSDAPLDPYGMCD